MLAQNRRSKIAVGGPYLHTRVSRKLRAEGQGLGRAIEGAQRESSRSWKHAEMYAPKRLWAADVDGSGSIDGRKRGECYRIIGGCRYL